MPSFPDRELLCIGLTRILGSLLRDNLWLPVYGRKRNNWRDPESKGFGDLFYCARRAGFRSHRNDGRKKCRRLAGDPGRGVARHHFRARLHPQSFSARKALAGNGVDEIMSRDVTVTNSNEPVENCMRLMTEKRIRHLPVVDNGKLRGVLSIGDLVKHIISTQSATIEHLESYIHGGYR